MRSPDLDKERSEKVRSLADFLRLYNEKLPGSFPQASLGLLKEFKAAHPHFFKTDEWSLDLHRKKVMDWLRSRSTPSTPLS